MRRFRGHGFCLGVVVLVLCALVQMSVSRALRTRRRDEAHDGGVALVLAHCFRPPVAGRRGLRPRAQFGHPVTSPADVSADVLRAHLGLNGLTRPRAPTWLARRPLYSSSESPADPFAFRA
jgi:hypothetical protein